jgi:hypothetical protein
LTDQRGALDPKLFNKLPSDRKSLETSPDFFDAAYIGTLAATLSNDSTAASEWRAMLLNKKTEDGSWFPLRQPAYGLGTVAATSSAVTTLAISYRLLPAYGR